MAMALALPSAGFVGMSFAMSTLKLRRTSPGRVCLHALFVAAKSGTQQLLNN
jgi:hypothetical protein